MKKTYFFNLSALVLLAFAAGGCQDMENTNLRNNTCRVQASIEGHTTRVGLSQGETSLDLVARWQQDDQVNIFVTKGTDSYDIGLVPVQELSANGKSCRFQFFMPRALDGVTDGYRMNCFSSECGPKVQDGDIRCNASLVRSPLNSFKARVMASQQVDGPDCTIPFHHYGVYEILHFTNCSDKDITFSLCGYEAESLWYNNVGMAMRTSDNSYVEDSSYEPMAASPVVTIPAQGTETIVSWYVPNGKKIDNASIIAEIDGNRITSSNAISSDVTLSIGNAYHIYAAWDGSRARFTKGNVTPEGDIPAEAVDLGLPSGTKWASYNVGATKPEEYGGYYAWGETEVKDSYTNDNYQYKNTYQEELGRNICFTDYDVAHVKWGDAWRMPTGAEFDELWNNCSHDWTNVNGVNGMRLTGSNGNSIFLPAAGTYYEKIEAEGYSGSYRAGTYTPSWFGFDSYGLEGFNDYFVANGLSVRPVQDPRGAPLIRVFPQEIDFGVVKQGTDKTKTFKVTNVSNSNVTFHIDGSSQFSYRFEVSDNRVNCTLAPGESREFTVTSHGMEATCEASTIILVKSDTNDEEHKVSLLAVGNDDTPLIDKTSMTLAVGERNWVKINAVNTWSYHISTEGGQIGYWEYFGYAKETELEDGYDSKEENGYSKPAFIATQAGVAVVTFTNKDASKTAVLTITVTDGSASEIPAEAIDLGLASGTRWASYNMGATKPEEVGGYYAWGETETKDSYTWSNYTHCDGSESTCHDIGSDIGGTKYDVANVKWGEGWRMPSLEQWQEMITACSRETMTINGVEGLKLTSNTNGNSIFLPLTGSKWDDGCYYTENIYCWLSALSNKGTSYAYYLTYQGEGIGFGRDFERYIGLPVRPVMAEPEAEPHGNNGNNGLHAPRMMPSRHP